MIEGGCARCEPVVRRWCSGLVVVSVPEMSGSDEDENERCSDSECNACDDERRSDYSGQPSPPPTDGSPTPTTEGLQDGKEVPGMAEEGAIGALLGIILEAFSVQPLPSAPGDLMQLDVDDLLEGPYAAADETEEMEELGWPRDSRPQKSARRAEYTARCLAGPPGRARRFQRGAP